MTIIYISDFDLGGSGYSNIGVGLCTQLAERGREVLALGPGYKGQEHPHPFKIIPASRLQDILPMLSQLLATGIKAEAVVVALDIPIQEKLLSQLEAPCELPYVGVFPLEAPPLCTPWAISLSRMHERLIMSEFGQAALMEKGIPATFIPIPPSGGWKPPTPEERNLLRKGLGIQEGQFVVLTVADNQERKNLSQAMEIYAGLDDREARYWMVTNPSTPVGWKLEDYAAELGFFNELVIWKRGMSQKDLWGLYAAADVMLLTSKAEGLGMPVLEAMACNMPVVGSRHTGIEEHLKDGCGLLINTNYDVIDVWGNSRRYFTDVDDGTYKLKLLRTGMDDLDRTKMTEAARQYVHQRTWPGAADILEAAIGRAHGKATAA